MAPLLASLLLFLFGAHASDITPNPDLVLGRYVPNVELIDEEGNSKRLSDVVRGRPTILTFIYTRCTSACPIIVRSIKETLSKLGYGNYHVLLVDFDERDYPQNLRDFRKRQGIPEDWSLALARGDNLKNLAGSLDFKFFYDEETDMFAHPNVLIVLSPSLRVSGYMLGVTFDPKKLSVMLAKAEVEKVELSWVKGLFLKCFRYDPVAGTYVIDWSFVAMVVGGLIPILGMSYFLFLRDMLSGLRRAV